MYDKAPPTLFYSNKGSRIFHYTLLGPHNYIFNLMRIYIYIYLFVCLVDDGTAYCKRAIYNSTLTLVCGVGERERERERESVLGWVNL